MAATEKHQAQTQATKNQNAVTGNEDYNKPKINQETLKGDQAIPRPGVN